jgi:hypothetical protein
LTQISYKHLLPGDRDLAEKCKDFAQKNIKTIANLTAQKFTKEGYVTLLKACHMCGFINAAHWNDGDCPSPDGTNFSDSTFLTDKELTQFSYSLFELMGGKL